MNLKGAKIGEEYLTKSKRYATLQSVMDGKYKFITKGTGVCFECLENGRSKSGTGAYDIISSFPLWNDGADNISEWSESQNGITTDHIAIEENIRSFNIGPSDYSKHKIQPWDIWLEYGLNPWDADIVKRVLRNKEGECRKLDYQKIIHICQERIRQLDFL